MVIMASRYYAIFIGLLLLPFFFRLASASPEPGWREFPGSDLREANCELFYYPVAEDSDNGVFKKGELQGKVRFQLPVATDRDISFCSESFMLAIIDNCKHETDMRLRIEMVERIHPRLLPPSEEFPFERCEMRFFFIVPVEMVQKKEKGRDAIDSECLRISVNCARQGQQQKIKHCGDIDKAFDELFEALDKWRALNVE